jgi:hypothetical protein
MGTTNGLVRARARARRVRIGVQKILGTGGEQKLSPWLVVCSADTRGPTWPRVREVTIEAPGPVTAVGPGAHGICLQVSETLRAIRG